MATVCVQDKLTAEKRAATEALETRIRALEGNSGAEKADLASQLRDAERMLDECAPAACRGGISRSEPRRRL